MGKSWKGEESTHMITYTKDTGVQIVNYVTLRHLLDF